MAEVTLTDVTKQYSDTIAVNDVSLEVADGEFLSLVGPSGCGKSTTLETIAGLTKPTAGTIAIGARNVTDLPPKDRDIAMVFQNIALFPHMDVFDNISFGLRIRKLPDDEIEQRVTEAAEIVQMGGLYDRMPDELSGGQRQRVAISRAIVRDPALFLMDEPLANLDAKLRDHMRTEIQRIHKKLDTTIVYVTHDQEEAMTMSDRIVVLDAGEIQQVAAPLDCYNEPNNRFVADFIGSPSMNFVDGVIDGSAVVTPFFELAIGDRSDVGSDGRPVTVGIRPEDIYLQSDDSVDELFNSATARVEVLEPMGDKIVVELYFDGDDEEYRFVMSVPPEADVEEDQSLDVVFDRSNVHLFDAETGDAITHSLT